MENKKLNEKIIFVRTALNLTQEEFAKKMNVSFATVNRWENSRNRPTKRQQIKLLLLYEKLTKTYKNDLL